VWAWSIRWVPISPSETLADVPRGGDVRGVGVHVVDPQEERLVGVVDKLGRGVLDVEHPRGVEEGTIVALARSLEPRRRNGDVASWIHASTVGWAARYRLYRLDPTLVTNGSNSSNPSGYPQ